MSKYLSEHAKNFFEEKHKVDIELALVRSDGIILYSNIQHKDRSSVVGALVSGVWQASRALANFVSNDDFFNFRLAFDTSSDGVIVLPININHKEYLLFGMYNNVFNPAVIKQKMKVIRMKLEGHFIDHEPVKTPEPKDSGYLFSNITDDEIDNLFINFGS